MKKFIIILLLAFSCCMAQLDVSPQGTTGSPGSVMAVAFNLTNPSAHPVDAFGMKIHYPSDLVEYSAVVKTGTLTKDWIQVAASEIQPGLLNVGAFHTSPVTTSGVLFIVEFNVKPEAQGSGEIWLTDFIDDLTGAQTQKDTLTIADNLTVIFPNGREAWAPGSTQLISWEADELQDKLQCQYSMDSGMTWKTIANNLDNTGCYLWTLPSTASINARIKIQSMTSPNVSDISDADFFIGAPAAPGIFTSSISGESGEKCVDICINGNTQAISALGLTVAYDTTHLALVQVDKGDLTQDWIQISGSENTRGEITIGGFHTTPLAVNSNGVIAKIRFNAICSDCGECSQSVLTISNLIDDVQGMNIGYGTYSYASSCALGDVTMDGTLTPSDALCAFQIYMNGGAPTPGGKCDTPCALFAADANCNGVITPDDALLIFKAYMDGDTSMECPGATAKARPTDREIIQIEKSAMPGENVEIPIIVSHTTDLNAFGAVVEFSPDILEFSGFERSQYTSDWFHVDVMKVKDGLIRIGGFDPQNVSETEETILLTLLFTATGNASCSSDIFCLNTVDGLTNTQSQIASVKIDAQELMPESFGLNSNFPNPFNMDTEIVFRLMDSDFTELRIVDIRGQHVRTLLQKDMQAGIHRIVWDGQSSQHRDMASGIYFCILTSGNQRTLIKMALIR